MKAAVKSPWGQNDESHHETTKFLRMPWVKNIKQRHLQVFIIGSAIIGIAGAMLTTLDGQFTPVSYQPLKIHFPSLDNGNSWGIWE